MRQLYRVFQRRDGPLMPASRRASKRRSGPDRGRIGRKARAASSDSAGICGDPGISMRLLHAGFSHDHLRVSQRKSLSLRSRNPRAIERQPLPLHRLSEYRCRRIVGGRAFAYEFRVGMATILRLKDIGKIWHIERTREEVVALGGISLDVEQGEFLVFVGPSGCGKSTLLQIIAALEKPASGTVEVSRSADTHKQ